MRAFAERHPNLTTWFVLAVGMLIVLAWSARDVELTARQFFWLGVATVLLAGLCAWIISWEADEPDDETEASNGGRPERADEPGAATAATAASQPEGGAKDPVRDAPAVTERPGPGDDQSD